MSLYINICELGFFLIAAFFSPFPRAPLVVAGYKTCISFDIAHRHEEFKATNSGAMLTVLQSLYVQLAISKRYPTIVAIPMLTFLYIFCPPYSLPDLVFVREIRFACKCAMESVAKVLISQGIFAAHKKEF